MQELEKILEKIEQRKARAEKLIVKPPHDKLDQVANDTAEAFIEAYKECQDIIRKYMNDGWIPVEKALPPEPPEYVDDEDDLEQYIVMIDGAERPTTLRYAGDGTWWEDGTYYHVIAWRPMPEVYRPADKTERSEGE